jgi:hypothetical protein
MNEARVVIEMLLRSISYMELAGLEPATSWVR